MMDAAKSPRQNFEAFIAGMDGREDDTQFVLRYSGEGLAEAAEYLRAHPTAEAAEMLLMIARLHTVSLCANNMPVEALRTGVMALQMLFILRINPEGCARVYVHTWLDLGVYSALASQALGDADGHFEAVTDMSQGMVLACVDAYGLASDPQFGMMADAVGADLAEAGRKPVFDGHPITPYMAVDILADIWQRLAAVAPVEE